jgi:hypothetical protein
MEILKELLNRLVEFDKNLSNQLVEFVRARGNFTAAESLLVMTVTVYTPTVIVVQYLRDISQ